MTRNVFTVRQLLTDIAKHLLVHQDINKSIVGNTQIKSSELFEDNYACLILVTKYYNKLRTKYLTIKFHHFKYQVHNRSVKVTKVDTKLNWVYIITKCLDRYTVDTLVNSIMNQ